jgi:hypothetical protein
MVAPGRVELPTFGLGNRCSIHLSYGAKAKLPHYLMTICPHKRGGSGRSVQFGFRARPENREIPLFD